MISAAQWKAYNEAVEAIRSQASSAAEAEVLAWCDMHPGADVAEVREAAGEILNGLVQTYDQAGAALAASWYDSRGKAAGARLDRAVTAVTYTKHDVDKLVRYQAEKLASGDVDGFAAMCGEYAANDAMKSVNRTVLSNARRDSSKGVRFARVTSGLNTCAFCLMLAGRGAVYNSRKSAGEFDHWHRHCTCKVVPSFTGNTYEVLVEGHDPKKIEDRLKEVESLTGAKRGTKEFTREVALRDPEWLYGGGIEIELEEGARPNEREMGTAESLANAGIKCTFRATRESESKRTSDVLVNNAPWEFKQPHGTGKNNIYNQFNEASGQSDKLVIDCSRSPFGFEGVCARAESSLARRSDFSEVIVCGNDRYAHFIK